MAHYQRITFIIPCRNNVKYLKQAINSIEDCYGDTHNIVILDDASTDGTWEWIQLMEEKHPYIKSYRNEGPDRVGHTVLYDIGIKLAETPIVTILHSDMIVTQNYVSNMLKHLKPLSVVSATRIEPPLHPPGPEKYVKDFGMEPETFDKAAFQKFVYETEYVTEGKITKGIFAPWMLYKEDFVQIGGHDLLFAPMELEDSDIFNRFHLQQYELIQSRDAFVYHMTCRGSRFKDGIEIEREIPLPDGTIWYKPKDSKEYLELRQNKFKEWWRKWHTDVLHDDLMMPIVPNRYDTTFVVHNCNEYLLQALEPWCDRLYVDCEYQNYVNNEQKETMFDISDKIHLIGDEMKGDVQIMFDASKLTNDNFAQFIKNIPFIIQQTDSVGSFEWDVFQLHIFNLRTKDMVIPFFKNIF
jgi:glycosyltransferase involved in cell wall biosynthesis